MIFSSRVPLGRDIFKQSADEFHGTGVGLAIVKRAIERMGGSVGVESEPGKGSKFWIELAKATEGE